MNPLGYSRSSPRSKVEARKIGGVRPPCCSSFPTPDVPQPACASCVSMDREDDAKDDEGMMEGDGDGKEEEEEEEEEEEASIAARTIPARETCRATSQLK